MRVDFKANKLSFMIRTAAAASAPTSFRPAFLYPVDLMVDPVDPVDLIPSVLERLQIAAWLKGEGSKLFKAGNYEKAAEK